MTSRSQMILVRALHVTCLGLAITVVFASLTADTGGHVFGISNPVLNTIVLLTLVGGALSASVVLLVLEPKWRLAYAAILFAVLVLLAPAVLS